MTYQGDLIEDQGLYFAFTSRSAAGVPTVLAGTPALAVRLDDSTTNVTAGITLTVDHDGVVGRNMVKIDTSADAAYAAGGDFSVSLTAGTVGGVSVVGEVVGTFSIENRSELISSAAADNLEATYNGTGYTDDAAPATQLAVSQIANVGSAVHEVAESYVLTTGTQSANTVGDTVALDLIRHEHTDDAGAMELYYQFDVGANGVPSEVIITGFLNSANDDLTVYGWNWVSSAWVQIGELNGTGGSADGVHSFNMFTSMVGTGANLGKIRVRFFAASGLTSATLRVDQIFIAYSVIDTALGFVNGAVWIDTVSGVSGATGTIGHLDNPVDNLADAYTIAAANNLRRYQIEPKSSITLPADSTDRSFMGDQYNVALNGSDIDGSTFSGAASISGTATASTGNPPSFFTCGIGDVTLPPSTGFQCGFFGTFTIGSAGSFTWGGSATVFDLPFIIDFGAANNASLFHLQSWGGGHLEIQNAGAGTGTYVFDMNGTGDLTINANCSDDFQVDLHGHIDLTNNSSVTTIDVCSNYHDTNITAAVDLSPKLDELHKLEGLDSANPVTTTPTSRVAGSVTQVISGDGITTSTVTRP